MNCREFPVLVRQACLKLSYPLWFKRGKYLTKFWSSSSSPLASAPHFCECVCLCLARLMLLLQVSVPVKERFRRSEVLLVSTKSVLFNLFDRQQWIVIGVGVYATFECFWARHSDIFSGSTHLSLVKQARARSGKRWGVKVRSEKVHRILPLHYALLNQRSCEQRLLRKVGLTLWRESV